MIILTKAYLYESRNMYDEAISILNNIISSDTGYDCSIKIDAYKMLIDLYQKTNKNDLERITMQDRVIYSSFNHYTILKIKELNPEAKTGFLYADGPIDMPQYGKKYGVDALHPALYNLQYEGFVEECRKRNLEINVWTVNEDEHIRIAAQMGVHAIITNYPDKAKRILEQL